MLSCNAFRHRELIDFPSSGMAPFSSSLVRDAMNHLVREAMDHFEGGSIAVNSSHLLACS